MFEYTASMCSQNDIFDHLCEDLKNKLKTYKPFVIIHNNGKKHSICVAFDDDFAKIGKAIIEDCIINFIIYDYKKVYLRNYIHAKRCSKQSVEQLLGALIKFESNVDREIVIEHMPVCTSEIVIDSFITFMLQQLINRWNDIVVIINNNLEMLISENSYEELLKYFEQNNAREIQMYCETKKVKLSGKIAENDLFFDYSADDLQNLIIELISLSPEKIVVFGDKKQFEIISKHVPEYLLEKTVMTNLK